MLPQARGTWRSRKGAAGVSSSGCQCPPFIFLTFPFLILKGKKYPLEDYKMALHEYWGKHGDLKPRFYLTSSPPS